MLTEIISPEYSEKFLPLTSEEVENLKKRRTKTAFALIAFSVFWYAILYVIISQTPDTFFRIFGMIFACFPVLMLGFMMWSATRDIKFGQKKIVRGRIDEKKEHTTHRSSSRTGSSSSTTYYYFMMSGKEITVGAGDYNGFQTGDIVEIEMMPKSSDVIKIRELQSNLVQKTNEKKPVFASDHDKRFLKTQQIYDTAQLTMEEENLLKKLRNKRIFWTLFIGAIIGFILFIVFVVLLAIVIMPSLTEFNLSKNIRVGIYWAGIAAIAGSVLLVLFKRISPLMRDLSEGRKNIIKAVIEDKERSNVRIVSKNVRITSSRGDFHYVIISGKYYDIPPEKFEKIQGGETVKLHIVPHSGTFLKVEGL